MAVKLQLLLWEMSELGGVLIRSQHASGLAGGSYKRPILRMPELKDTQEIIDFCRQPSLIKLQQLHKEHSES